LHCPPSGREAEPKTKLIETTERNKNMATKTIEVMVGKKADQTIEPEKIGKAVATAAAEPEGESEVGGRAYYWRWAQFSCGHICRIWYDDSSYHAYECAYGDAVDVF
jgi:hypothetical protein